MDFSPPTWLVPAEAESWLKKVLGDVGNALRGARGQHWIDTQGRKWRSVAVTVNRRYNGSSWVEGAPTAALVFQVMRQQWTTIAGFDEFGHTLVTAAPLVANFANLGLEPQ